MMDKVNVPPKSEAASQLQWAYELVQAIPEDQREAAFGDVLQGIDSIYSRYGAAQPAWLTAALSSTTPSPLADVEHCLLTAWTSEALRLVVRRKARAHPRGITGVAEEAGLPVQALRRFLAGALVNRRTWDALQPRFDAAEVDPPPLALVGIGLLTATLPERVRGRVRLQIAENLGAVLAAAEVSKPAWLTEVLEGM
jgi:hypothetical protein